MSGTRDLASETAIYLLRPAYMPTDLQRSSMHSIRTEYVLFPVRDVVSDFRSVHSSGADARDSTSQSPDRCWNGAVQQCESKELGPCVEAA